MTNINKYILFIFCIIFSSCVLITSYGRDYKRAQIEYNNHNYDKAIEYCIKSLKRKPGYEKSLEIYEKTIPLAINTHHNQIEKYTNTPSNEDNLVKQYEKLFNLIKIIEDASISKSYLVYIELDYNSKYNLALEKAAESHYQNGINLMSYKDKRKYKKAINEFMITNGYIDNYKNVNDYIAECKKNAIFSITIMNFENNTNKKDYDNIGHSISNKLVSKLSNNSSFIEFVNIVDREQFNIIIEQLKLSTSGLVEEEENQIQIGKVKGVDHIIIGDINQLIIKSPKYTFDRLNIAHQIQVGENIIINEDSTQTIDPVYETAFSYIKKHTVNASSSIEIFIKIINVETSEIINSQTFYSNSPFLDEWTTGLDNISPIDIAIIALKDKKTTQNAETPNTQELLEKAIKRTTSDITNYIIKFYE